MMCFGKVRIRNKLKHICQYCCSSSLSSSVTVSQNVMFSGVGKGCIGNEWVKTISGITVLINSHLVFPKYLHKKYVVTFSSIQRENPADIYLFKVTNRNTRKKIREICSTLTIKIQNDVTDIVLVFLLLILNIFTTLT